MIRGAGTTARAALLAILWLCGTASASFAQAGAAQPPSDSALAAILADPQVNVPAEDPPGTLVFSNRPIVEFRARVLSRPPAARAVTAAARLGEILGRGVYAPVRAREIGGSMMVSVGGDDVFAIVPGDTDPVAGETTSSVGAATVERLTIAMAEAAELRTPSRMIGAVLLAALATAALFGFLILLRRAHATLDSRVTTVADRGLTRMPVGEVVRATRFMEWLHRGVTFAMVVVSFLLGYAWLTFVLRRFPYTRPWGESLRGFVVQELAFIGGAIVDGLPKLVTIVLIVATARVAVRLSNAFFLAIEAGRITVPWVYQDTARPTRQIVAAALWLSALALAYPYLPGSDTDAFKGLSVFVGLVISLGSTGIVNQMMSGLTLTYSRALRLGDFVRVGDVEGIVAHLGALSAKILTERGEEVTIPNAVIVTAQITNLTKPSGNEGVFMPTELTIGYDTPWRQVEWLLLLAADRTAGILKDPRPFVRLVALEDFFVRYALNVCLEQPSRRAATLDRLHVCILDAFNEHGVQIMSPHYESDPAGPKVVPVDRWQGPPDDVASVQHRGDVISTE